MTFAIFTLALLMVAYGMRAKARWRRPTAGPGKGTAIPVRAAEVGADEIRAYFVDAHRLRYSPISETVACLGPWDSYDDWDWGRVIYEWKRPGLRVMVMTQSDYIRKVAVLDPKDGTRFGKIEKLLLDEPFDIDRTFNPEDE